MENRKELIEKFRKQVAGGKYADRYTLLSYAFLRGVPYAALERIINEDNPSFGYGRTSFLEGLAYVIVHRIGNAQFSGKTPYSLRKEGEYEKAKECDTFMDLCKTEVRSWIQEKYKAKTEVAA